jgi:hypothetical protein
MQASTQITFKEILGEFLSLVTKKMEKIQFKLTQRIFVHESHQLLSLFF